MPQDSPDRAFVETQNWASRSHRELYDAVHIANDPGRVGQLADEWKKLGREMAESADRMSDKLRSTESGWQGEAADAARSAIQKLADWSRDAGESADALAGRMSEQGRIMETAKAEMPEPVKGGKEIHAQAASTFAAGDLESFTKAMDDLHANQERSSGAHEQAVRVMARMEESSRAIDGDTPRFTQPPDPVEELKTRSTTKAAAASTGAAGSSTGGEAPTQQQSAAAGAEATQKMTRPASVGQQPSAPPLAAQTGPAGTGSDGAPLAAQTGPAGANAPTKRMQIPKVGGSVDGPTVRASPVKPANASPSNQKPPSLEEHKPKSTNPQSTTAFQGGDRQNEKTKKMRTHQGPDAGGHGPGGRRPGGPGNRDGNRDRLGQMPPIPPTTGPEGQIPPIGTTNAASGASFGGGGGAAPPMPPSGGAAGGNMAPGGMTGTGGAPGADHGGSGPSQAGAAGAGQAGSGGAGGMMGGGAMGGAMGNRGGQGGQDEERRAKYVEGGPVVEVPGKDLPPPVIGEGKKKKKSEE